jgi:hypothetical protein
MRHRMDRSRARAFRRAGQTPSGGLGA